MTLKELIILNKNSFDFIADIIEITYYESKDNKYIERKELYRSIWHELLRIEPIKTEMTIIMKQIVEEFDNEIEIYYTICAYKKDDVNVTYAIELCHWAEWLGMEVLDKSLEEYGHHYFLANCLWEMTWFGFTEDTIQRKKQEILTSVEEAQSDEAKIFTWKEIIDNFQF